MPINRPRSHDLFVAAQTLLPGGVNSPVRAFRSVGGEPVFIERAEGAYLFGADGERYIDYVGSWGPMIAGHAHPHVVAAVQAAATQGLSFGAPCAAETVMAERIRALYPSMELMRMTSSGTEAAMSAIRLARGFTGRDAIIKFEGCYHGHADSLLVKAGSGALTLGVPSSPGVPADLAQHTLTCQFNDLDEVEAVFKARGEEIACVAVEPVAGNMNCIPPVQGFLEGLRNLCDRYGAALLFDEVMTGFRVAAGGAQQRYGVRPDLTCLGKIVGGGMPVGVFGGRRDIMERLAPLGPVYQAGTLSGNPIAMAAGLATLDLLSEPGFHDLLEARTAELCLGLEIAASEAGIPLHTQMAGGMFGLFFTEAEEVTTYAEVMACDRARFNRFFHGMLDRGVYLAPSAFEAGFVSAAHRDEDIARTHAAAREVFAGLG